MPSLFVETKLGWRQDWTTLSACAADINKIEQNLSWFRLKFEQCRLMNIFMRKVENSCFTRTHNEWYAWWMPERSLYSEKLSSFHSKTQHPRISSRWCFSFPPELSCSPKIWIEWVITFPSHAGSGSKRKWRKGNGNVLTGGCQGNDSLAQRTPKNEKTSIAFYLEKEWMKFQKLCAVSLRITLQYICVCATLYCAVGVEVLGFRLQIGSLLPLKLPDLLIHKKCVCFADKNALLQCWQVQIGIVY